MGDRILDAAASCVVDFGVDRVTLQRGVHGRPTVYRRWPDSPSIVAALLTQRITDVMREVAPARRRRCGPPQTGGQRAST